MLRKQYMEGIDMEGQVSCVSYHVNHSNKMTNLGMQ